VFLGYNFRIVLQKLLIVAVFLNLFAYHYDDQRGQAASAAQGQKAASQTAPVAVQDHGGNKLQQDPASHQTKNDPWSVRVIGFPPKDKYDYISLGATLLLTLVGIVGVGVGICTLVYLRKQAAETRLQRKVMARQLEEMKRQADLMEQQAADAREAAAEATKLARQSAEAATTNAEALINSERAWVNVEIDEPPFLTRDASGNGIVWIRPKVKNYGRTPARVEMIIYRPHQIPKDDRFPKPPQLPAEPDYVSPETVYTDLQAFLPPTAAVVPLQIPVPELDFAAIRGRAVFLYIYGQVLYRDMLETGRGAKFCYVYWVPDDPADPNPEIFMTDGNTPQAYLEYT
jgi:hypothetical protein